MSRSGGSVSTGGATRLVHVIGMLKWIALIIITVGIVGATVLSVVAGGTTSVPPSY